MTGHEAFSLHPLMTVTHGRARTLPACLRQWLRFHTPKPLAVVTRPWQRRSGSVRCASPRPTAAAYHAAAAIAANFLVTLESAAAELMSTAGLDREVLLPLATAALENWARQGPAALTGPIARGDRRTVARHREVVDGSNTGSVADSSRR